MGSYCSDFRVIRACLAGISPLYHSFDLPYTCPIMCTSSKPNRSSGMHIGGRPVEEYESRRTDGGSGSHASWSIKPLQRIIHPHLEKARERLVRFGTLVVPNI